MRSEYHATQRIILLSILVLLAFTSAFIMLSAGMATAQELPDQDEFTNESDGADAEDRVDDADTESVIYEFPDRDGDATGTELLDVEFDNGTALVTLRAEERTSIALAEGGVEEGGFNNQQYTIPAGETSTFELAVRDEVVSITTRSGGYIARGDVSLITIFTSAPTHVQVYWGALGGGLGVLLSLAMSVGMIKRQHHNTYKELLSEERVRVEEGRVDGVWGTIKHVLERYKVIAAVAATVALYLVLARLGFIPRLSDVWLLLSDTHRIVIALTTLFLAAGFTPVYALALRLWEPATEFVFDLDARDVIDSAIGSKGGLSALEDIENGTDAKDAAEDLENDGISVVAIYSGSPERVAQMTVDGAPADVTTTGGPGYLVQDFNPKQNTAEGTWPGLANDFELARARSNIDANREILEDWATVGRRIISALPAIRSGADAAAVAAVDAKLADAKSIDSDPVDDIMDSTVHGTRFERYYNGTRVESGDEYDENKVTNDNDDENGGGK